MAVRSIAQGLILACAATLAVAGAAAANSLSADVQVKVNLVTSSGACGATAGDPAVQVTCQLRGGPLVPAAGAVPYQRVSSDSLGSLGVAKERLPVYSFGTNISSWRIVQLDNDRYLELTIAW
ncbi:hypothetical protein JJB11_04160 [Ramlibacter ginsenosidimutans]|uniref:Spore coat protein U domain-containing protein n=1 Tax=Ramlibacter ginsenosidimutans TaxID=502333 RepID=A0A934TPT1_9BURK|nr:hypothetical protein [Ramlibacter ginsenosidimutans]MBK6005277.1 hypothetical protein [Ramlibacter ginsenosidimutans]